MPKLAKLVGILIKLPPNMAVAGWDIDENRVREFCEHFGITKDVQFRWTAGIGTVGCHRLKRNAGRWYHGITINQYRDIEESRNTILHELCHAIQKDDINVAEWRIRQRNERRLFGYYDSPIEKEARDFADNMVAEWGDILY